MAVVVPVVAVVIVALTVAVVIAALVLVVVVVVGKTVMLGTIPQTRPPTLVMLRPRAMACVPKAGKYCD